MRGASLFAAFITGTVFASAVVFAWTGPTSAPPNGNVSPPINVGTTDQIKNAGLGINSLAVFGNGTLAGNLGINNTTPSVSRRPSPCRTHPRRGLRRFPSLRL